MDLTRDPRIGLGLWEFNVVPQEIPSEWEQGGATIIRPGNAECSRANAEQPPCRGSSSLAVELNGKEVTRVYVSYKTEYTKPENYVIGDKIERRCTS